MSFTIIQARILCRASKNRGKVVPLLKINFKNEKASAKIFFLLKMTNCAEMITKWLQRRIKLVKMAKMRLVSQIFVRNRQESFLKIVYATDGQNERDFL